MTVNNCTRWCPGREPVAGVAPTKFFVHAGILKIGLGALLVLLGATVPGGTAFAQTVPTVSITAPAAVNEGGTLVYTVTRSAAAATPLTVNFTRGGTATAGTDYTAPGTTVIIPANATSATVSVVTIDDAVTEPAESVIIRLAAGAGYTVAAAPANAAAGLIRASDLPVVSITAPAPVVEGGTLVYTLTRSLVAATPLTVNFTRAGTATAGSDYTAPATSVIIPANATSATVSVVTIDDAATEPNESVILRLAANAAYVVAAVPANQASGIIRASDPPTVSISAPAPVNEGGTLVYTVTRSPVAATALAVNFTLAGTATAGADYTAPAPLSVVIPANAASATVSVPTINDPTTEPNESVVVRLAARPGVYVIAAAPANAAAGLIRASDPVVRATVNIAAPAAPVTEGGTLTFPVTRSAAAATPLTVNYTVTGTATSGVDYTALPGTVTIPANATTANVSLTTIDDATLESAESLVITLAAGAGYTVGAPASRTGFINDNDAGPVPNVSINSSSRSCGGVGQVPCNNTPVVQQPAPGAAGTGTFRVLAVNDLGMHLADLDSRVASIRPPGNVLRAQVIQHPPTGDAPIRNPAGVTVAFSAASNPTDPALAVAPTRAPNTNGVYKSNFWDIATAAYGPLYPAAPSNPFLAPFSLAVSLDLGLPIPSLAGPLQFTQQPMPGQLAPYTTAANGNAPKSFGPLVATRPFFSGAAFGYQATLNAYTAEGIPVTPVDDVGRENPYPLFRVQARNATAVVATTDAVVPVSSEVNCTNCHAAPSDMGTNSRTPIPTNALTSAGQPVALAANDPQFGNVPRAVSVEWASDSNILRLHDLRNGTNLFGSQPVVCQTCHYSTALDLGQVGPADVNGRVQSNKPTLSRAIHGRHAATTLFPDMPAPIQLSDGTVTNQATRLQVLDQTCFNCHPGRRTPFLRGAMANGGVVCQDCHGDMDEIANDFSRNRPTSFAGLTGDFYTNVNTPRVPWVNEPGCGSCHTGDAVGNLAATAGAVVNTRDSQGNVDGIRLRQAWRSNDTNKKPIVPANKRFAENVITAGATTPPGNNPKLFRLSSDNHGAANGGGSGLLCQSCHGSTHAEWPNATANANDNLAATQLQGHSGFITECRTCHGTALDNYNGLDGPHGIHVIGPNSPFANPNLHSVLGSNYANCRVCHGGTSRGSSTGTVLSRATANKTIGGNQVTKGTPIACTLCH